MFIVTEIEVVNELTSFPEFVSNWTVHHINGDSPVLTTASEDKAHSLAFSLNNRANSRSM